MNEWKEYKLGEVCSLITDGKHGDCENEENSGYFFLSAKDIFDGRLNYEKAREIKEKDFLETHRRTRLEIGDIVVTNSGTIGRMAITKNEKLTPKTTFQKSVAILKVKHEIVKSSYLYYELLGSKNRLVDVAVGSAQPNLLLGDLRKFKILVPPLQTQQKIANILGTYDELIEVNNERIKILEETAQSLYKERFVRFRFPNYQDTEFIKGVPKGWEVKEISELCEVTSSKRVFLEDYVEEGIVFYRGKEITLKSNNEPITDLLYISVKKFEDIKKRFGVPKIGDLLITAVGTIGNVHLVNEGDGEFYFKDGNLIWLRNVENDDLSTFLFSYLRTDEMMSRFDSIAIGSSQKALTISAIKKLKLLLPENKVLINFHEIVNPMFTQIQTLQQQNTELRQIRDRLLPRLISGKIVV